MKFFSHPCYLLLIICGLLTPLRLPSQIIVYGTPGQAARAMIINDLGKAARSFATGVSAKAGFKAELDKVRQQFWSADAGKRPKELAQGYNDLLLEKDMYFLGLALAEAVSESLTGQESIIAFVDQLMGGQLDGGVYPVAKWEYERWLNKVLYEWRTNAKDIYDRAAFADAIEASSEAYLNYALKRDFAEYWYHGFNRKVSELSEKEYIDLLVNFIGSTHPHADHTDYLTQLREVFGVEATSKGIAHFRAEHNLDNDRFIKSLIGPIDGRNWIVILDYYIARLVPEQYGMYLIKRHFLCDWELARRIYQNRMERYGSQVVQRAVNAVYEQSDDYWALCTPNPEWYRLREFKLDRNESEAIIYGGATYRYQSNGDCAASGIDERTIWWDLYDLIPNDLNWDELRTNFRTKVLDKTIRAERELASPISNTELSDLYAAITAIINEQLLLKAYYLQAEYGPLLIQSEGNPNYAEIGAEGGIYHVLCLLDGLVSLEADAATFLYLNWIRKTQAELRTSNYAELITEATKNYSSNWQQLSEKYSKDRLNKATENVILHSRNEMLAYVSDGIEYYENNDFALDMPYNFITFYDRSNYFTMFVRTDFESLLKQELEEPTDFVPRLIPKPTEPLTLTVEKSTIKAYPQPTNADSGQQQTDKSNAATRQGSAAGRSRGGRVTAPTRTPSRSSSGTPAGKIVYTVPLPPAVDYDQPGFVSELPESLIADKNNQDEKLEEGIALWSNRYDKWAGAYDPSQYPLEAIHQKKFPDAPKYTWDNVARGVSMKSMTYLDDQVIFRNEDLTIFLSTVTYSPEGADDQAGSFDYSVYVEMNIGDDQAIYDPAQFDALVSSLIIPIIEQQFGENAIKAKVYPNGRRSYNLFCDLGVKGYHRRNDTLLNDVEWQAMIENGRNSFNRSLSRGYYDTPAALYRGWSSKIPSKQGLVQGGVYKPEGRDQFAMWIASGNYNSINDFLKR